MFVTGKRIIWRLQANQEGDLSERARLRAALRPHTAAAAVLIIAQRVSTIVDADQILVMEDGRIVERGNFRSLIDANGRFAGMWALQQEEDAERRSAEESA